MSSILEARESAQSEPQLKRAERDRVAESIGEKLYAHFNELPDDMLLIDAIPHWSDQDGGRNYAHLMGLLTDARERQIASMALNALRFAAEQQKHVYPNIEDAPYPSLQIVKDVEGYDFTGIGISGIKRSGSILLDRAFRREQNQTT